MMKVRMKSGSGFLGKHTKSSAFVATLIVHLAIGVLAVSFVVIQHIPPPDAEFVNIQVARKKMPLRKLEIPVNMNQNKSKPKPKKVVHITTKVPKMDMIKIPDLPGVSDGTVMRSGGDNSGWNTVGFTMPEIKIFDMKAPGEKVFIVLDATRSMLKDELGGIPAYELVKAELINVLSGLEPTILFNIAVCDMGNAYVHFPALVSATPANVEKVRAWLEPLNRYDPGTKQLQVGLKTLEFGKDMLKLEGKYKDQEYLETVKSPSAFAPAIMEAMAQRADAVFVLTGTWGYNFHKIGEKNVSESVKRNWLKATEVAREKLAAENEDRARKGLPPRIFQNSWDMTRAYFPDLPGYYPNIDYHYTPKDLAEAFQLVRKEAGGSTAVAVTAGISSEKRKHRYSVNVIHFVPKGQEDDGLNKFKQMAKLLDGKYRRIEGLESIMSSASPVTAAQFEQQQAAASTEQNDL